MKIKTDVGRLTCLRDDSCKSEGLVPVDSLDTLDLQLIDDFPSTDIVQKDGIIALNEDFT